MRARFLLCLAAALALATSGEAAVKTYNADEDNGSRGDIRRSATNLCPPVVITPGAGPEGSHTILDDGLGTVTLNEFNMVFRNVTDLSADEGLLVPTFGPGAFVFTQRSETTFIGAPQTSNTTGIGSHGPSSTAPGSSAEWGVLSGFQITGSLFCIASPTTICTQSLGAPHGMTVPTVLNSPTYDLGTWNFDAVGDMESANWLIVGTFSGGMTNSSYFLRGAFQGASLPALPLLGFGALGCALVVMGARALRGQR